jgi:hypothetical protein
MDSFVPLSSPLGTWDLVSFWWRLPDGEMVQPWSEHPVGRITYDANGFVTAPLMHESRNEASGQRSPAEIQADYSAYFGSYIGEKFGETTNSRMDR